MRNEISPDEYANVVDYIKYNEWGLSMETLIDYLGDREATTTPEQYRLISDAMVEMGMEDSPVSQLLEASLRREMIFPPLTFTSAKRSPNLEIKIAFAYKTQNLRRRPSPRQIKTVTAKLRPIKLARTRIP